MAPTQRERLHVLLTNSGARSLTLAAAAEGVSKTAIVNSAVRLYWEVTRRQRDGDTIALIHPDGIAVELVIP